MGFLTNFAAKLLAIMLQKLASWGMRALELFFKKKEAEKKVDQEIEALKNAVNDAKKDGVISDEEEKRIREASRNLINGTFD